ncbi:MAG: hypothetical protein ACHRXM_06190 [Isosphaerales bacterium]
MAHQYYVRDGRGRVAGPYSGEALRKYARGGKLLPSWHISTDREHWKLAAKVQNLFNEVDKSLSSSVSRDHRYRNLTRKEQVALFVDEFVFKNEHFKDSMPWLQGLRAWWVKLTLPDRGFVIAEVTASAIRHIRYDFEKEQASEVAQKEFEEQITGGVRQSNWFTAFSIIVALAWVVWTIKDFIGNFNLTFGTLKTVLFVTLVVLGFIYKTKRSKVFVGYVLDSDAEQKLKAIADAFAILRRCNGVWAYELRTHASEKLWKYNAGSLFSVAKLPIVFFNRPIPNIETNIRVTGLTYLRMAIYFLPGKLLVIDGTQVFHVEYHGLGLSHTHLDYVETEGHVYPDSLIIDHRWKFINRDGSRDRRFKDNVELPVVRCGILVLEVADYPIRLMTTNPDAPEMFSQQLPVLDNKTDATS